MKYFLNGVFNIPDAEILKARLQSLAMLDAILMPDWTLRFFSFNSRWAADEMMASMRDGEGSEFFFLFGFAGVAGKIYCHAERRETKTILKQVPLEFASFLSEAAFNLHQITCCLWQLRGGDYWTLAPQMEERIPLLAFVGDQGEYYRVWAERYYGRSLPTVSVRAIFERQPLTEDLLLSLNGDMDMRKISADVAEIGYRVV